MTPSPSVPTTPPAPDTRPWLERWLETRGDLAAPKHPMTGAVIDEQQGRMIRIGDHWLADFASSDYLGLDLDKEIIAAVPRYLGACSSYQEIEDTLIELLGCEDALVMPTMTDIHLSAIPLLAGTGTIFLDARADRTIVAGCEVARSRGATVKRFRFQDPDHLARALRESGSGATLVCIDGVNAMTGNAPDLRAFAAVARAHGALLYVDDAHGFGVIGERAPRETCAYGMRGNGVVKHANETYDNIVLVGDFSKAYSSLLAFIACPTEIKDVLKVAMPRSGPSPIASLATVLEGLKVNEQRGDELRARLCELSVRVLNAVDHAGIYTPNRSSFPIIELPLRDRTRIAEVGRFLFDRGIYVTLAAFPLVPKAEVGFRAQITAAHTDDEIFMLIETIGELAERGELQMV